MQVLSKIMLGDVRRDWISGFCELLWTLPTIMTFQKKRAELRGIEWTSDDEMLEAWCVENGFDPYDLAFRVAAESQERWDRYVEDLKRYAASPNVSPDLGAWLNHVDPPYDYKKNWAVMPNGKICVKD